MNKIQMRYLCRYVSITPPGKVLKTALETMVDVHTMDGYIPESEVGITGKKKPTTRKRIVGVIFGPTEKNGSYLLKEDGEIFILKI